MKITVTISKAGNAYDGGQGVLDFTADTKIAHNQNSDGGVKVQLPSAEATISVTNAEFCAGEVGNSVTATVTGTDDFSINWGHSGVVTDGSDKKKGNINAASFPGQAAPYTLTATLTDNTTGKTSTASYTITSKPKPKAPTLSASKTLACPNDEITVNVTNSGNYTAAATYTWTPAPSPATTGSSAKYTWTATTTYQATVTESNGCTGPAGSVTVNAKTLVIEATATPPTVNLGSAVQLSASETSTNTGTVTYTWDAPVSQSGTPVSYTPTSKGSHTYTVRGTQGGCSASATVDVDVVVPSLLLTPAGASICAGTTAGGTVSVTAAGGYPGAAGYVYEWSTAAGSPLSVAGNGSSATVTVPANTAAGTYPVHVKVTDHDTPVNEKETDVTVTVTKLGVTLSPNKSTITLGEEVTLTAGPSGATFTWNDFGGAVTTVNTQKDTPTAEGKKTYTISAKDNTGCSGEASTEVTVGAPGALVVEAIPASICSGKDVTLSSAVDGGMKPYTYRWSSTNTGHFTVNGPNTDPTVVIKTNGELAAGTYQEVKLTVWDSRGVEQSATATITITKLNVSISPASSTILTGESITLTAGGPAGTNFNWAAPIVTNVTSPTQTVSPTPAGEYTYTVNGEQNGCTGTATATVKVNDPDLAAETTGGNVCAGMSVDVACNVTSGTAPYRYEWSVPDGQGLSIVGATDATSAKVKVDESMAAGAYEASVRITDAKNKTVTKKATIQVSRLNVTLSPDPNPVKMGESVTLTAGGETSGVTYSWKSIVSGAEVPLSGAENPKVVTPDAAGNHVYKVIGKRNDGCTGDAQTTVNVQSVALSVAPAEVTLCAGLSGVVGVEPQGGISPYTYEWISLNPKITLTNTDQQQVMFTVANDLPAGDYTLNVTVKDAATPKASKSVNVTVHVTNLSVTLTPSATELTKGENLMLTAASPDDPNVNYTWQSPLSGTDNPKYVTMDQIGTKTYKVKGDKAGCTGWATTQVIVKEPVAGELVVTLPQPLDPICPGKTTQVKIEVTGGTEDYSFEWVSLEPKITFNNQYTQNPFITVPADLPGGTYGLHVTVTDANNKKKELDIPVTVKHPLSIAKVETHCLTTTVYEVQITVSGGDGGTYGIYSDANATVPVTGAVWADRTVTVTGLTESQTYYLRESPDGCNVQTVNVQKPSCTCDAVLTMDVSDPTCAASDIPMTITLKATGGTSYSFDLIDIEGHTVLAVQDDRQKNEWKYSVDKDHAGPYRVAHFKAVTAMAAAGCEGQVPVDEVNVQFYKTPIIDINSSPAGDMNNLVASCGDDLVTLTATGQGAPGISFQWDKGVENGQPFTPPYNVSTVYTVTGTSSEGCVATKEITVKVTPKPTVTVTGGADVCAGEMVTLTASGDADSYTWNDTKVQNGLPFPASITSKYIVTAKYNATGCTDTASVLVVVNDPPQILKWSKDVRKIAIGKNADFWVQAAGKNLAYQWQRKVNGDWVNLADGTTNLPEIDGVTTDSIVLKNVPRSWDGVLLRCLVTGDCGDDNHEFTLSVKECFDIAVTLETGEGIMPDEVPGDAIDGWYCIGTRIALKARITSADGEDYDIENPRYKWYIDGLPAQKVIESDSSLLTWIPEYYENDIVVKVCAYSDGACDTVCAKYLRLKARPFEDAKVKILTSIDPEREFCPGDEITFWVSSYKGGLEPKFHWFNDIFDLGEKEKFTLKMKEEDTWFRVVMDPSKEICTQGAIEDTIHLRVKKTVRPSLRIVASDTVVCQGDEVQLHAEWENAGDQPLFQWWADIWNGGTDSKTTVKVEDRDVWVKCRLTPSGDVCFDEETGVMRDTIQIRVLEETGKVTIASDMTGKEPGDELTFTSEVENILGTKVYEWYVNDRKVRETEPEYVTDELQQGDIVWLEVSGDKVCQTKIRSNELAVDYGKDVDIRELMVDVYRNGEIRDLDLSREGDEDCLFKIPKDGYPMYGNANITGNGVFKYKPHSDWATSDIVMYTVTNKFNKTKVDTGYVYINILDESSEFVVPNIITPNGDGLNDDWKLDFLMSREYPDHLITVFSRESKIVFQARNYYEQNWPSSGQNSGISAQLDLPNGVYTYIIDLGDKRLLKGWLEIRRNMTRGKYR